MGCWMARGMQLSHVGHFLALRGADDILWLGCWTLMSVESLLASSRPPGSAEGVGVRRPFKVAAQPAQTAPKSHCRGGLSHVDLSGS